MKRLCAGVLLFLWSQSGAFAEDKPPVLRYLGEWSDGRGEVLLITPNKIKMGSHPSSYKEIFRSKDLRFFRFQLTSGGGGFAGRYFSVEVSREEMRMREYRTLADSLNDRQAAAVISWERDR